MLSAHLNQTAEYRPRTGTDDRGQPAYGEPVALPCRRQQKAQNVLSSTGQTIATRHVYYLNRVVSEGDLLDGLVVMGVTLMNGLGGAVVGCKAVM